MNGKKAKRIRKKIYGDHAHTARSYVVQIAHKNGDSYLTGAKMNRPGSLRNQYLKEKRG